MKLHRDEGIIRPNDNGSMYSLIPGLYQQKIKPNKDLRYGHSQVHNKASILLLIIINVILIGCGGPGENFNITSVRLAIGLLLYLLYISG